MATHQTLIENLLRGIHSHYPLIYVLGWEESRLESQLKQLSTRLFDRDDALTSWSFARGFNSDEYTLSDPIAVLTKIAQSDQPGIYLLKDFPALLTDNPVLTRALRDLYYELRHKNIFIVLSHPILVLPENIKKEVFLIRMPLPSESEILTTLKATLNSYPDAQLDENILHPLSMAMLGLSLNEVDHLFTRMVKMKTTDQQRLLEEIAQEKSQVLSKESCLRFITRQTPIEDIGGLEKLKKWVMERKNLFTREAFDSGVPIPPGLLLMGVSGCGKSMAAKAIASAWNVQLVRLDMSLVLSGSYGSPESAFEHAIRIAEEIAPVVLWIDELENAFGYDEKAAGSGNVNIFSSFLTWMQEKSPRVFVAATANRIQQLPAELMRKGRFDQLFFLNLPTSDERQQIFRIHIERNNGDAKDFDVSYLAAATKEWSGAEIEAAVNAARVAAFQQGREFNHADVAHATGQMVPLSKTMHEQIKAIKSWSYNRAVPASNPE